MSEHSKTEAAESKLWHFELFGGLKATSRRGVLDRFPTQRTAGLAALLAHNAGRRLPREQIADILWPDAELPAARDRLSQALVWLRREMEFDAATRGAVLVTDRLSVGLNGASVTTDVAEFERLVSAAQRAPNSHAAIATLASAVENYKADLLPGLFYDWVLSERRRLLELLLQALARLTAHFLAEKDFASALKYARLAVAADETREESHGDLIRVLSESGQNGPALRQFESLKQILRRELDTEPSPQIARIVDEMRSKASTPMALAKARSIARLPLPSPVTRFFGRESEVAGISGTIVDGDVRLLTLTGAGGSGKTRLALASAARIQMASSMEAAFVPLADLNDAQQTMLSIASALGLGSPDASSAILIDRIVEILAQSDFLLVVDNIEHLVESVAPILKALLERAPRLKVLATSRQRLGLDGEREHPVRPLPLPRISGELDDVAFSPSVQLFVDRASAVQPGFQVTPENAAIIAQLCARLEGIPLAIELCAAWAQMLTPLQMLDKLQRRFDLLISRRLDITPRHRTLRAAVEYGYLLLPPDLQKLFTRLSVFRGGWDLDAAVEVCSETVESNPIALLSAMTELRERSLIFAEEITVADGESEMRYRMLDTLREFGAEQLTWADRAQRRQLHLQYFSDLAVRAEATMPGAEQKRHLARLASEHENIRAAFAWSLEHGAIGDGLRLASALGVFWTIHGPLQEGYDYLRQLLDAAEAASGSSSVPDDVLSKAWRTLGHLAWSQANYSIARDAHQKALGLRRAAGDPAAIIETLYHLGITAYRQDDYAGARPYLEESLALAREQNDRASIARVLLNLGNIAYGEGRLDEGLDLFEQTMQIEKSLGNRQRVADTMNNMGLIALAKKDYNLATTMFEESLGVYRQLANNNGSALVLANLGTITRMIGDTAKAREQLTEGLRVAFDYGNKFVLIHYFLQIGILEASTGNSGRGVVLMSAADHLSAVIDGSRYINDADGYPEALTVARTALGYEEFDRLWTLARTLPQSGLVELALAPASSILA